MVFNKEKQRGVKNIPSPRIIDFHKSSSYEDIINKGRSVFFENESDDLTCYSLCGPSGFPFEIASPLGFGGVHETSWVSTKQTQTVHHVHFIRTCLC